MKIYLLNVSEVLFFFNFEEIKNRYEEIFKYFFFVVKRNGR